jgi:hypothetical protein
MFFNSDIIKTQILVILGFVNGKHSFTLFPFYLINIFITKLLERPPTFEELGGFSCASFADINEKQENVGHYRYIANYTQCSSIRKVCKKCHKKERLFIKTRLREWDQCSILRAWENQRAGRLPSFIGGANPPDERKEGMPMYVTYSDLIQMGIFICALVGVCYTLFKGKRK